MYDALMYGLNMFLFINNYENDLCERGQDTARKVCQS